MKAHVKQKLSLQKKGELAHMMMIFSPYYSFGIFPLPISQAPPDLLHSLIY